MASKSESRRFRLQKSSSQESHSVNVTRPFKFQLKIQIIDLFSLYILFSQYRSRDNTQEVWFFGLFIKRHIHACMHSF